MNRFLSLVGLLVITALASCEVESVEVQEELIDSTVPGTVSDPKDGKD